MKLLKILLVLFFLSAVLSLFAELKIHEKGNFEIGGLSARIKCFDNQWRGCTQAERHFIVKKKDEKAAKKKQSERCFS